MPYATTLRRSDKPRSGIALGGIGSGGIELRQDGVFHNWHIFNNEPFAPGPRHPFYEDGLLFFVVRYQVEGEHPRLKLLQIEAGYQVAAIESHPAAYIFPWLSGVERIEYRAAFPFAWLRFHDSQMPFDVELEAFSPFIPHDVKDSSLPAVIFNFKIVSRSRKPVDVMLMASLRNSAGYDQPARTYRTTIGRGPDHRSLELGCTDLDPASPACGTLALASLDPGSTHYAGWDHNHPYYETCLRSRQLPDLDDTPARNTPDPQTGRPRPASRCFATLAASRRLAPRSRFEHTFLFAWHFPNLYSEPRPGAPARLVGNYYNNFFPAAAGVADYLRHNLAGLQARTRRFHDDFYASSAPACLLDQVNSHLNTFVSSAWLTRDGTFGILEGLTGEKTWGLLATMDVALYGGVSHLMLFPELDRNMLRAHARLQADYGGINHTLTRNFDFPDAVDRSRGRLDLPAQFAILCLRNAFCCDDPDFLGEMWPHVRRALDYVLRERDANRDGLPDMTGIMCSYDNFPMYGVSSYIGSLWLSALAHAVRAAQALGDAQAEAKYAEVWKRAGASFQEKLWNGKYFRLYNDDPPTAVEKAAGGVGEHDPVDEGCMTDQLIGQWCNHLTGLGDLVGRAQRLSAYRAILEGSFDPQYGLRNCHWPGDGWLHDVHPEWWVDQANTCWSGVELAFAAALLYDGLPRQALRLVENVDRRYRALGLYFDHQEWGGHYYRPMAAWGLVNALLGLSIDRGRFRFEPRLPGGRLRLFFCTPGGWGHYTHDRTRGRIRLSVSAGELACRELAFAGWKGKARARLQGRTVAAGSGSGELRFGFDPILVLRAGQSLDILIT